MRVLMFGWEFPPFIAGGLGVACHGLTRSLSKRGVEVTFVLPRPVDINEPTHVRLRSTRGYIASHPTPGGGEEVDYFEPDMGMDETTMQRDFANVKFRAVPGALYHSYPDTFQEAGKQVPVGAADDGDPVTGAPPPDRSAPPSVLDKAGLPRSPNGGGGIDYTGDLIGEAQHYAFRCLTLARQEPFDVVHAHDWLTYPAGIAVAQATGKPLVVHVHSTEFDRAGDHIHQEVYDIERRGMHAATRVICVSKLTASIVEHRYGVPASRIDVVYNGLENGIAETTPQMNIRKQDRIVLFLGRITMQKGPEYFIGAAKHVLEKVPNAKFIMAGTGDKTRDIIELAAAEGIGHRVLFTGFLHRKDVERVYQMADVYVMPSVSEPFGIACLEAISHDVPVIISKTSGVSEVLTHALKVDFWDTQEMANKIIAVLKHPPLSSTLRAHADIEVRRLSWDDAARKCHDSYERAIAPAMAGA